MNGKNGNKYVQAVLAFVVVLVLAVALLFRCVDLDHIPGVNGDEAYYGITVLELRDGHSPPLRTYSGLPLNPFYSGPLFLFHLVWWSPSFVVMRLPALLSIVAAVGLSYPLMSRALDRRTALIVMLLLACLPISIAYSRFGWDQSQAPLVSLIFLYFVLTERTRWAFAAFAAALLVHPLNLFLGPLLAGPDIVRGAFAQLDAPAEERRAWLRRMLPRAGAVLGVAVVGVIVVLVALRSADERFQVLIENGLGRVFSITGWARFAARYGELLNGTTIYRYIVGPMDAASVWRDRLAFWGIALILFAVGIPRLVRRRDVKALGLILGLALSLAAFYILLGTEPISPNHERYSMWLITPSCVALAMLVRTFGDSDQNWQLQLAGVTLVSGLLLFSFQQQYFTAIRETGGQAHWTFRTGPVEPKQAAFDAIVKTATDAGSITVLAEDYWSQRPIRYLAEGRPGMQVLDGALSSAGDLEAAERYFAVGVPGGPYEDWLAKNAAGLPCETFDDFGGRPLIRVWDLGGDRERVERLRAEARRKGP